MQSIQSSFTYFKIKDDNNMVPLTSADDPPLANSSLLFVTTQDTFKSLNWNLTPEISLECDISKLGISFFDHSTTNEIQKPAIKNALMRMRKSLLERCFTPKDLLQLAQGLKQYDCLVGFASSLINYAISLKDLELVKNVIQIIEWHTLENEEANIFLHPLDYASEYGHWEIFEYLMTLDHSQCSSAVKNSVLLHACEDPNPKILELIVNKWDDLDWNGTFFSPLKLILRSKCKIKILEMLKKNNVLSLAKPDLLISFLTSSVEMRSETSSNFLKNMLIDANLDIKSKVITLFETDLHKYLTVSDFIALAERFIGDNDFFCLLFLINNFIYDIKELDRSTQRFYQKLLWHLKAEQEKNIANSIFGFMVENRVPLNLIMEDPCFNVEKQSEFMKALFAIDHNKRECALNNCIAFFHKNKASPDDIINIIKSFKFYVPKNLKDIFPTIWRLYEFHKKEIQKASIYLPQIVAAAMILEEPTLRNLPKNNTLQDNLDLGKAISSYIAKRIKYSTNYLQRSIDKGHLKDIEYKTAKYWNKILAFKGEDEFERLYCMTNNYIECQKSDEDRKMAQFQKIIACADNYLLGWESLLIKVGNCSQMMKAAHFVRSTLNIQHITITPCEVIGGDHVIFLIGLSPEAVFEDPETWGETAVLCDPWNNNQVYPAKEIFTRMKPLDINASKNSGIKNHPLNGNNRWQPYTTEWDCSMHGIKILAPSNFSLRV